MYAIKKKNANYKIKPVQIKKRTAGLPNKQRGNFSSLKIHKKY